MTRLFASTAVIAAALIAAGCGQKRAPAEASQLPPPGEEQTAANDQYDAQGSYIGPGSQMDLRRTAGSDRVFFELNSAVLDNVDKNSLRRQASWLAQYPNVSVTIEGHCDERGTRDYNLALGERRANAARNYFAGLGVDLGRMNVVSYGKERPDALGSDGESWAQNRRAVTVVIR